MTIEITPAVHRQLAVDLFNHTWELMEKESRTPDEADEMIHAAHASRYHWGVVGDALNRQRGEWQVSRVYALEKHPEACLYHAKRCLEITLDAGIGDFDRAFAFEAMARAYSLMAVDSEVAHYRTLALEAAEMIQDADDRQYFLGEVNSLPVNT